LASTDNDDSQMTDYTVTTVAAADDATTAQPHLLQPKKKVGQRQRQRRNKAIAKAAAAASTAAMQQVGDKGNAQEQNGKMSATGFVPGAMSKVGPMVGSKGQRYQPNPWQRRQSRREEIKQLNEAAAFEAAGDAELCGIQARQEPSDTCDTFSCKNVRGVASDTIVDVTVASQLNGDERDMVHNPSDNTLVPSHIKSGGHFPPELSRQYQAVSRNDDDDCIAVTGEKLDATATLSLDVGDLEETVNTVPMPIHVGKKVRKPRPGKRQRAHRKALLLAALHDQNDPLSMVRTALSLDDPWHYESAAADDDELSVEFQEAESRVAKELLAFLDDQ
jgi:hypothetical protein